MRVPHVPVNIVNDISFNFIALRKNSSGAKRVRCMRVRTYGFYFQRRAPVECQHRADAVSSLLYGTRDVKSLMKHLAFISEGIDISVGSDF